MTQNAAILAHLRSGATLTPLGALSLFGCLRLARVINDLRNLGHEISTTMVDRNGKRFAEYSLEPQWQAAETSDRGAASASPAPAPLASEEAA